MLWYGSRGIPTDGGRARNTQDHEDVDYPIVLFRLLRPRVVSPWSLILSLELIADKVPCSTWLRRFDRSETVVLAAPANAR